MSLTSDVVGQGAWGVGVGVGVHPVPGSVCRAPPVIWVFPGPVCHTQCLQTASITPAAQVLVLCLR